MSLQNLLDKAQSKVEQLNPYLRKKALELIELIYNNGYEIIITQGYRSIEEQNDLYNQGRTTPGNIVTNAKGGQSYHNWRLAFDIAILNQDGSIDWDSNYKYMAIGKLGESIGLEWGGSWDAFKDLPHFQYTYGFSWQQLMNGTSIPDYPLDYKDWLQKGDSGDSVRELQRKLVLLHYNINIDGIFGNDTDYAVRDFQIKAGLAVDGEVGSITMAKINEWVVANTMSKYFKDLPKNHWCSNTIDELYEMGIVNGDGNGNIKPDDYITRAEVMAVIRNTIKYITGK
jgi:hypothetical protein